MGLTLTLTLTLTLSIMLESSHWGGLEFPHILPRLANIG